MACSVLQSMSLLYVFLPLFCANLFYCGILLLERSDRSLEQVVLNSEVYAEGFGFSAIVNDYKIVRAYAKYDGVINGVEVYSLSTGSWKEIEFGPLKGVSLFGGTVTANGSIFWHVLKSDVEDDIEMVVSFDIATEVFTLIPWPPLSDGSSSKLSVYEDKLAVISLSGIGDFPNYLYSLIDLWVLEEVIDSSTERWRWTKKYTCNSCPSMLDYPVTIWRNEIVCAYLGKPIFTNESGGREMETDEENFGLYLINIITNECKMLAVPGRYWGNGFNYVESLVPVGNIQFEAPSG
ncbi:F-box/kelch-repeat protein At3g06240-like [Neltuma alba]|uniref:F-box/kelch-repeat protein At3g06240-like n=1 Tax=Neltuma alba TaxID=207710 RepID=UPI0010A5314E|nr:F-box/kelch-repeat protein At3g06240-like [Prosopis alba]